MRLRVECYASYRGEQEPRMLVLGDRRVEVQEILDRWLGPDHRYFKVRGDDSAVYVIRHDRVRDAWELSAVDRTDAGPAGDQSEPT